MLAALAGVGATADAVHGDGQAFVRLLAQGAIAHSAGLKATANAVHAFHIVNINGQALGRKGEHAAQVLVSKFAAAQLLGEFLKELVIALLAGLLQLHNRLRINHMLFALVAILVMRAGIIAKEVDIALHKGGLMAHGNLLSDFIQANAL